MASQTIPGIFRDGKVELGSIPPGLVDGTPVSVEVPVPAEARAEGETLRQQAFADMEAGLDLGGPPYPTRDELHDRHGR